MANSQMVMLVIKSYRPRFRNSSDKVAFVVHATFVASGYKLVAVGRSAFAKDALASSPTLDEVGIEGWNEFDEYAFVYVNPKKGSRKILLVKCLTIGDKLLVGAVAAGGTYNPAHLMITVKKYVAEAREEGDYDAQFKNLGKLVTKLQKHILDKLDNEGLKLVNYTTGVSSNREREEEPEPVDYPRGPFPLGPPFHHPSGVVVVDRLDYSHLIPGPPPGNGFGDRSMLAGPHDPRMLLRPGFMGSPQPGPEKMWLTPPEKRRCLLDEAQNREQLRDLLVAMDSPPRSRYDPIGPDFETGRFGRQPSWAQGNIHSDLDHFPRGFGSDFR